MNESKHHRCPLFDIEIAPEDWQQIQFDSQTIGGCRTGKTYSSGDKASFTLTWDAISWLSAIGSTSESMPLCIWQTRQRSKFELLVSFWGWDRHSQSAPAGRTCDNDPNNNKIIVTIRNNRWNIFIIYWGLSPAKWLYLGRQFHR